MVIRLFLATLVFDFLVWLPFFHYGYKPWAVNLHQSGVISFGFFSVMSLIASLMPLLFIVSLLLVYHYFENRQPMELKTLKNNKKVLVSKKAT